MREDGGGCKARAGGDPRLVKGVSDSDGMDRRVCVCGGGGGVQQLFKCR